MSSRIAAYLESERDRHLAELAELARFPSVSAVAAHRPDLLACAGWLRDPAAMVAMAKLVVERVGMPVTVKTRIGYGPESEMPIVDLARRLEDAGVRALTIHCRTARMGHSGDADWSWAARAREVVSMPVIVNGDIKSAQHAASALDDRKPTVMSTVQIARNQFT